MMTPRQKAAAQLLALGATGREVARTVSVNVNTLSRWRKRPDFRSYLVDLLKEGDAAAIESLFALKTKAVDRIAKLLDSENEAIALRAAEAVLDRTASEVLSTLPAGDDDGADFRRFIAAVMAKAQGSRDAQ